MKILILIVLLLSGCASWIPEEDDPVLPEAKKVVDIDKRALEPCKSLLEMPMNPLTFETLLENHKDNTIIYLDCRTKQNNSIKLLKEFANQ